MLLTRKTTAMPPLFLHNGTEMIQEVKTYKYLGIYISADLRWDVHINNICLKCKKLLGLLYRRFYTCANSAFLYHLYLSLVRPILDYVCQVWDPFTKKNIDQLESVQKFALKICAHCWDINYLELLDMFNISNLETRRIYIHLTTFHKVVNGSSPDTLLQYSPVRATRQSAKYLKIPSKSPLQEDSPSSLLLFSILYTYGIT